MRYYGVWYKNNFGSTNDETTVDDNFEIGKTNLQILSQLQVLNTLFFQFTEQSSARHRHAYDVIAHMRGHIYKYIYIYIFIILISYYLFAEHLQVVRLVALFLRRDCPVLITR